MRVIKTIFDFYINSSIHVALAVVALSWITLLQFEIVFDKNILFFIFFSSITGYNFVKYFGLAKFHYRGLTTALKAIQLFSLSCFIALCCYCFKLEKQTLLYVGIFGLITFLYAIPLIPKTIFIDRKKNLRSISGLKIYVIALVWIGVTLFLPLINTNYGISEPVILIAIQRFIFVIVLMLPFEIRDLKYDSLKLSTVPQNIGVTRTKILGFLLLIIVCSLEFLKEKTTIEFSVIQIVISVILLLFLIYAREQQHPYYSAFWVESIPIFWLILMWIFF